jgi:hypothetical protein
MAPPVFGDYNRISAFRKPGGIIDFSGGIPLRGEIARSRARVIVCSIGMIDFRGGQALRGPWFCLIGSADEFCG